MEEDGTDRFERADTDSRHTLYPQHWRHTERQRRFGVNKQKALDATLFNSQHGSDDDQLYLNNYKKRRGRKKYPRAPSANKIPPSVLSGTLGLGVDAAEISSWRNPPNGG